MKVITITICILMLVSLSFSSVAATDDQSPSIPEIHGPCESKCGEMCEYTIQSIDPQGDNIYYSVRCSDDIACIELGPYESGEIIKFCHCWWTFYQHTNPFQIRVKAKDDYGHESEWGVFETNLTDIRIKDVILSPQHSVLFQLVNLLINRFSIQGDWMRFT
jgi:hypothetical protein